MPKGIYQIPYASNEPVREFAPGSEEVEGLIAQYKTMYNQAPIDVPMYIGGKEVRTDDKRPMSPPHDHKKVLGHYNYGNKTHVTQAMDAALASKADWANLTWKQRAAIFLNASDLLD